VSWRDIILPNIFGQSEAGPYAEALYLLKTLSTKTRRIKNNKNSKSPEEGTNGAKKSCYSFYFRV